MKKNKPVWLLCLIDLAALGAALVVFALFHHVIPTQKLALNLVSIQTTAQAETAEATQETQAMQASETVTPVAGSVQTLLPSVQGADALSTQNSFQSAGVTVSLSEHDYLGGSVKYYLADLWLEDVTALKTAFAQNTYGSGYTDTVPRMDSLLNAALCVNGDYYGNSDEGVVVRNGVIYRANPTDADILCLYYDGTMEVKAYRDFDAQAEADQGIWQAWTFGPSLLNSDGSAVSGFNEGRHMNGDNPRTVLGYYAPGHYAVLVVDGRGESAGLSLDELAGLCEELGFTLAYNLDGGKSSVMTFNDAIVNQPAGGGRAISDVIYIAEDSL